MAQRIGRLVYIPFDIPATELAAGTSIELVSPVAGAVHKVFTTVQTAIVTGGDITFQIGTTDITGLVITVANSATKGTTQSDTPTTPSTTRFVAEGGRMQVTPAAAFNGGGAVSGVLVIETGKVRD